MRRGCDAWGIIRGLGRVATGGRIERPQLARRLGGRFWASSRVGTVRRARCGAPLTSSLTRSRSADGEHCYRVHPVVSRGVSHPLARDDDQVDRAEATPRLLRQRRAGVSSRRGRGIGRRPKRVRRTPRPRAPAVVDERSRARSARSLFATSAEVAEHGRHLTSCSLRVAQRAGADQPASAGRDQAHGNSQARSAVLD